MTRRVDSQLARIHSEAREMFLYEFGQSERLQCNGVGCLTSRGDCSCSCFPPDAFIAVFRLGTSSYRSDDM